MQCLSKTVPSTSFFLKNITLEVFKNLVFCGIIILKLLLACPPLVWFNFNNFMNQNNIENPGKNVFSNEVEEDLISFWVKKFEDAGVKEEVGPFDAISSWKEDPRSTVGYGEPILVDVVIDGKKTDVYRASFGENNEEPSIYLHVKESR